MEPRHAGGIIETLLEDMISRLDGRIADSVREAIRAEMAKHGQAGAPGEVNGIDPNKLYTVAFLAERWSIDRDQTVRDIDQAVLPRASWHGSGIRYRGADILRYEGVDVGQAAPVTPLHPVVHSSPAKGSRANTSGKRRPYASNLPKL